MGVTKQYTRHMLDAGYRETVQALTQASTGTTIKNHGVTTIDTSAATGSGTLRYHIQAPEKGLRKTVLVDMSTTPVSIHANSTTTLFFGSTANVLDFTLSTTLTTGRRYVDLVGLSATEWGIANLSTAVALSGSTI